jgi:hypothetical protein
MLTPNDRYRFALTPSRPCFFFVLQADSHHAVSWLFPNTNFSAERNPLGGGAVHWIPAESSQRWLQLDEVPGTEHVFVFALTAPPRDVGLGRWCRS